MGYGEAEQPHHVITDPPEPYGSSISTLTLAGLGELGDTLAIRDA